MPLRVDHLVRRSSVNDIEEERSRNESSQEQKGARRGSAAGHCEGRRASS
jgi:hypothetical protein